MHRNTKRITKQFSKHGLNRVRRIGNEPKQNQKKKKKSQIQISKIKLIAKEDLSDKKKSNIEELIQTFPKLKSKIWLSLTHGHFVFI